MRILVAGFGNTLHGDDGFGVELLSRLRQRNDLPSDVTLLDAGIGGISLVQELLGDYDGLIVLDALEGGRAGDVRTLELQVPDPRTRSVTATRQEFADIHYAEPGRALALAKGIGSLPAAAYLVGCAPRACELGQGLSPAVEAALETAAAVTLELIASMTRVRGCQTRA